MGFSRGLEDGRISVLYCLPAWHGRVHAAGRRRAGGAAARRRWRARSRRARPRVARRIARSRSFLRDNHARRLVSLPLPGIDPPIRRVVRPGEPGRAHAGTAPASRLCRLRRRHPAVAGTVAGRSSFNSLTRLEQAAQLIPALLHVLDVREVIDRLSATARRALPHDLLLLNLFNDELTTFTVYARSDQGAGLGMVRPNPYPASTIQAWTLQHRRRSPLHPMERDSPSTTRLARVRRCVFPSASTTA